MSTNEPSPLESDKADEIDKALSNTLYLTLNAPKVDDYHRALFMTYPPSLCLSNPTMSGTLFHACYIDSVWHLEKRHVGNFAASSSLVLLWRIATLEGDVKAQFEKIENVLNAVSLGKSEDGDEGKKGNPELGGYDCIIWTRDALRKLVDEKLIFVGEKGIDQIMAEARAAAGPEDARTMVGKEFGGFRIINDTI